VSRDYVSIGLAYAKDIVSGEIPACVYVRQACQRQLDDLERSGPDWPYRFDPERATHVCRFIELLPHIKGKWAKERRNLELEPWQIFELTTVFGWVDAVGNRRFRTVYEEVPRKNAKSTKTSGVGLYLTTADREMGAEVYSAATTRDQARIVWEDAKRMVERTPGLRARFGVEVLAHHINVPRSSSVFKALSRDQGGNLDGLNVHGGLIDELHAHKTREIFDVIETGTGSRQQSLLWLITTAGFNRAGICYEQRAYVIKILSGAVIDDSYFGIIYTVDPEDLEDMDRLLSDPEVWRKANPNWDISVNPEDIARKARKAREMAAAQNNFLTKHLNVWVNADTAWMDMAAWDRCGDPSLDINDFEGEECVAACDLATKIDIVNKAKIFERDGHYYGFVDHYLNEQAVEDGRNSQYSGWARQGYFKVTPGNVTDYSYVEEDIRVDARRFDLTAIGFDPWQAEYLRQRLAEEGLNTIEIRQTVANMSESMKMLQSLVLEGRFHHNGCPILAWMVSNVVCHTDAKDNIYPRKEFPENKIDGVVALIMALKIALLNVIEKSVYEDHGIRTL
jgi:phage terminase large subunit-like protein